jgi:hypothetical protein
MLRRYEMYSLHPDAAPAAVQRLTQSFLDCGRFIAEVLDSAVGTNLSDAPVRLVWEHAYESPAAYQRYMVHPFHACILDRGLLADSPERIVTSNDFGAGLVGYECETPVYRLRAGVRRLVLVDLSPDRSPAAPARFADAVESASDGVEGLAVSVVAENSMAAAWFDGVTPITPPPRWSHVWEQGWESLAAFEAYQAQGREQWPDFVRQSASVHYELVTPG